MGLYADEWVSSLVWRALRRETGRLPQRNGAWIAIGGTDVGASGGRSDVWRGDLGESQRSQAPPLRLMRQARKEQDPATALRLKDASRTHDLGPATERRILHNLHLDLLADADKAPADRPSGRFIVQQVTPLIDTMTGTQGPHSDTFFFRVCLGRLCLIASFAGRAARLRPCVAAHPSPVGWSGGSRADGRGGRRPSPRTSRRSGGVTPRKASRATLAHRPHG